ncbi:MAG: LEA type 2 family protein [Bacteroidetes bacterium]|jgi:LEA14-like dessication related protein|nr:LEA type 2 family protein [Bacteroidota bacterium]MBK8368560.1 LEA type 2 family protein [Bacteroidota bacterium]
MKFKLFIIISCAFLFSCREAKEIKVKSVEGFYVNKLTTENIDAEIKVKIDNPNKMGFSIYPSEFDVIFSGIRLGKAKLSKRVHLNANSEKVYSFKLNSKLSELNPMDILRLLNLENLGKIEVNGDLKVGKFYFKKKYPVNYTDKVKIFN